MKQLTLILAIALAALCCSGAQADFVTNLTATTSPLADGLTRYTYILTNDPQSTLNAEGLGISIAANADLRSITGPTGWDITYLVGNTVVTWESSDISSYFVALGSSETFSFVSSLAPTQQPFLVSGTDSQGFDLDFNFGDIASPGLSAVPEPASLVLLGTGLLGLLGYAGSRSSRRVRG